MASPAVASLTPSPSRGSPATPTDTTAPSPASPPRRLASAPPAVDAASAGSSPPPAVDAASAGSSPVSAHSAVDQFSEPSSPLLASRSEEYRLLFRLPPDEVLMQDFNCALQENILLQGHMYLFLHHICFYSNIFGYETKKTIPLQEVTDVRKAKTAAIFPNAIEIVAGSKRHFFGSFLSRDEAFRIIVDSWEQHVSDARVLLERQDTKSASSSEENGYVLLEGAKDSKQDEDSSAVDRSVNCTAVTSSCGDSGESDINISKRFSEVQEDGAGDNTVALNPFSLGSNDDEIPNVPESYTMVAESKFQVSVEVFFNLLMSNSAFGFLDDFHKKCGDKEFSCSKWRLDEQGGLVRDVSFLHPIKIYLGAKFGTCKEMQKLRVYKNRRLVIRTSQSIGDAPYGDHFIVEGIWDVEQDSLDVNSCYLRQEKYVDLRHLLVPWTLPALSADITQHAFGPFGISVLVSPPGLQGYTFLDGNFRRFMRNGTTKMLKHSGKILLAVITWKIEQSTKDECREVFGLWIKLGHELLKQESNSQSKGVSGSPDAQSGAAPKSENPTQVTVPNVISEQDESDTRSLAAPIQDHQQRVGDSSIPSTSQERGGSLTSNVRSSQLGKVLAVALVVIIILMQVTIIFLLTRSPQVQMVPHGTSVDSFGGKESIEWMRKRLSLLSEEMQLAESHMERMRQEFVWLKSHLGRLERLRGNL